MQTVTRGAAAHLIRRSRGRIFRADFTKADGSPRRMLARVGVKPKDPKGPPRGIHAWTPESRERNVTVYDLDHALALKCEGGDPDKAFRSVPLDRLVALKLDGKEVRVEDRPDVLIARGKNVTVIDPKTEPARRFLADSVPSRFGGTFMVPSERFGTLKLAMHRAGLKVEG